MNNLVKFFSEKGYFLSPDFLDGLPEDFDKEKFLKLLGEYVKSKEEIIVLNKDLYESLMKNNSSFDFNWVEFDNARVLMEKGKDSNIYDTFLDVMNYEEKKQKLDKILVEVEKPEPEIEIKKENNNEGNVIILKSYMENSKKREVKDFVSYFKVRYESLKNILRNRQELQNVLSINKIKNKSSEELVSLIGLVSEKRITKNGNILLSMEDLTGEINVLINKNKIDLYNKGKDICLDQDIGIIGFFNKGFVFVNGLIFPEVSSIKELKKSSEEVYAAFISDIHVGNKVFLKNDFEKFLKWINGEKGSEKQKGVASKIKYLFIAGDLVDGVGIHPGQEGDLEIKDIYEQYNFFIDLIRKIPSDIKIIICPGNHDALRLAEPQPALSKSYVKDLYKMENVFLVSNPALINIHSNIDFKGFDVLMYHGMSSNYYASGVDSIRKEGGLVRADLLMKYLLQSRHLAPTHTSTSYIPDEKEDVLVIDKVPDVFVTGHIHRCSAVNYKGINLINASCWIKQTKFMEKVGLVPEPGRVVILNLQTRDIKILNFCEDDKSK